MNTKNVTDKVERKKLKRTARKKAAPKAKRAAGVARGSHEEKDPSPGAGPAQALISPIPTARAAARTREPFPDEEYRCTDRRLRRSGEEAAAHPGTVEPHRARYRRGDRLRHFHPHRHGRGRQKSITVKSILNAPVLDLHRAADQRAHRNWAGPARARRSRSRSCWWRSPALFAALCYAELASMIPIAGSAYTYTYATLGEIDRLDHRLGPDPGVRRLQHGGGGRLLRLSEGSASTMCSASILPAQIGLSAVSRRRAVHAAAGSISPRC